MKLTTEYIVYVGGREHFKTHNLREAKTRLEKAKKDIFECWVALHEVERRIISEEWIEDSEVINSYIGKKLSSNIVNYDDNFNDNLLCCIFGKMHISKIEDKGFYYRITIAWNGTQTTQDYGDFEKHMFHGDLDFVDLLKEITQ